MNIKTIGGREGEGERKRKGGGRERKREGGRRERRKRKRSGKEIHVVIRNM